MLRGQYGGEKATTLGVCENAAVQMNIVLGVSNMKDHAQKIKAF